MLNTKRKSLLFAGIMLISLVLSGCGNSVETTDKSGTPSQPAMTLPSYEIIEDESVADSAPGAPKVVWDIVVPKTVTKQSLTALLNSIYEKEKAAHSDAVVISIYAYADKDHQEEGMGRWLAWLMTNDGLEKVPTIQYNDQQIIGLSSGPEVRFGQNEDARKALYKQIAAIGDKYPDDIKAQNRELLRVGKPIHLTIKQFYAIADEGKQKEWALPPSSN